MSVSKFTGTMMLILFFGCVFCFFASYEGYGAASLVFGSALIGTLWLIKAVEIRHLRGFRSRAWLCLWRQHGKGRDRLGKN